MCCDHPENMMSTPVKEEIDENYNLDLIKDEAIACTELPILKFEVTEECLMLPITRPTLVYTTKIDDMNILNKDLNEYNCKDIIQMVLAESKPKYSNYNATTNTETDLLGHVKVLSFVEHINCKAKLEAESVNLETDFDQDIEYEVKLEEIVTERNLKLIKQCKPCSVLLEDIKKHPPRLVQNRKAKTLSRRYSSPDDNVALINLRTSDGLLNISQSKTVLIALVHINKEAYICRFNLRLKALTDYYVMSDYDDDTFDKMYPNEPRNIRHYCCWYKREMVIEMLALGSEWTYTKRTILLTMKQFLRQPHACPTGGCVCCCRVANAKPIKRTIQPYLRVKNPIQIKYMGTPLAKPVPSGKGVHPCSEIIHKAIYYNPVKRETLRKKDDKPEHTGFILLRLEKKERKIKKVENNPLSIHDPIILDDDTDLNIPVEFYIIGEGDIINTFTVNNKEEAKNVETTYISMNLSVVKKLYCCWYSRENLISRLRNHKFSTNVLKYLRTSHNCEANNCECCCKPKIAGGLEKLIRAREKTYTHWPAVLNHTTVYNKTPIHVTIPHAVLPITDQSKRTVTNNSTEVPPKHTTTSNIRVEDKNILDKFKKLKISVDSDGELEAVLDSPARNLSIIELKVLHHILSLSSKQIARMQISPKEFCRRLSSKETGVISFHPVISQRQTNDVINVESVVNQKQGNDAINIINHVVNQKQKNDVINVNPVVNQKLKKAVIQIEPVVNQKQANDKLIVNNISSVVYLEKSEMDLPNTMTSQENITQNKPTARGRGTDLYEELSQLMSAKSTHLGNSFRINYKSGNFSESLPKFWVLPRITKSALLSNPTRSGSPVLDTQIPTLTNTTSMSKKMPLLERSDGVDVLLKKALLSATKNKPNKDKNKEVCLLNETNRKRKISPSHVQEDKRIRVKPPSQLINIETHPTNTVKPLKFNSPVYTINNDVIHSQNLTSVAKNTTETVNLPASQRIIVQRINQPTETPASISHSMNSVPSTPGTKWMTVAPMPTTNDSDFGSLLSKMLQTPHVQPAAPYYIVMPPLVPIGSAPALLPNATFTSDLLQPNPTGTIKLEKTEDINHSSKKAPRPKIILEHRQPNKEKKGAGDLLACRRPANCTPNTIKMAPPKWPEIIIPDNHSNEEESEEEMITI